MVELDGKRWFQKLQKLVIFPDQTNSPQCEVLDIIIAFDTSESLSRIILPVKNEKVSIHYPVIFQKYVDFAKKLVAQYKINGITNTRVGVISFK